MKLSAVLLIGIVLANLWLQSQLRVKITKITTKEQLFDNTEASNLNIPEVQNTALSYYHSTPQAPENIGVMPLTAQLKKVNLISFWATWCTTCKTEFPQIQKLYEQWQDQGFQVLSVNCDQGPSTEEPLNMFKSFNLSFPVFFDSENLLVRLLQLEVLPTHLLVSETGEILLKMEGATQWKSSQIQNLIQEHL